MGILIASRLAEIVRDAAPLYVARDIAPSTPNQLHEASLTRVLPVWAGSSDATIFGDPATNHAFRAWHDSLHLKSGLGFSVAEEVELGRRQAVEVARLSGDKLATLVWLEVAGQALEYLRTGQFIADQLGWTRDQLRRMGVSP